MKIIYCSKKVLIDSLKDRPMAYTTSKIKTKFGKPKTIERKEFLSISNIEYLEYSEDTRLARIFDSLMAKRVFMCNYEDLDHMAMFHEYKKSNEGMAERIRKIAEKDDLVVINDSSLLLIPGMVDCRVAFRNVKFDHCFIERVPFYSEIMENLFMAQKFFRDLESLSSFNKYMLCSYEFAKAEKGGCWYLRPYVDKFAVIDTLEHFSYHIDKRQGKSREESCRFEKKILSCIERLPVPKQSPVILTDANLLHLEPFISRNPSAHIRYLRNSAVYDEYTEKMVQYIKKTYEINFDTVDVTDYSQVVVEMLYCDVFVGTEYHEVAQCFGKACINDSFDYVELETSIENALEAGPSKPTHIIGEEEYVYEFMRVNGYDIVLDQNSNEDKAIDQLSTEVMAWISHRGDYCKDSRCCDANLSRCGKGGVGSCKPKCITVCDEAERMLQYYKKVGSNSESELYMRRESVGKRRVEQRSDSAELPIIQGENTFKELQTRRKPKDLPKIDVEKVKAFWNKSKKTILLDYDGTLVGIVPDHETAVPTPELIELLHRLGKEARLVVCTGRSMETIDEWIPKEIEVFAEHGACHRKDGKWSSKAPLECLDQVREIVKYYELRTPGSQIEEKGTGLAFHFSHVPGFDPAKLYSLLRSTAGKHAGLGKNVVEVSSSKKDLACEEVDPTICIGDDVTDEDMFRVCNGVSIKIGQGKSYADGYLADVQECLKFLSELNE